MDARFSAAMIACIHRDNVVHGDIHGKKWTRECQSHKAVCPIRNISVCVELHRPTCLCTVG